MKIAKATPFEGKPMINMPSVFGGCKGKEILCRIPVTGKRPIQLEAEGLAEGLVLENGMIKGTVQEDYEFPVKITAENELGTTTMEVRFKIHEDYMLQTPLMGFTSWNAFSNTVSQQLMEETAEYILEEGIADYGYRYMNIDSGWQSREYGGEYDAIMPNEKFPDMKGFCDKMHAMGFKCGIYSTPMLNAWGGVPNIPGCTRGEPDIMFTCQNGGVGVEHLEENNAKQWEEWGFDYLKYDWQPCDTFNADLMKKALLRRNREMAFCVTVDAKYHFGKYWQKNCTSWRCNRDSLDDWEIVKGYMNTVMGWKDFVLPGHYYDLDMLEIGAMKWNQGKTRINENEAIFAYTMRAFFLSPIQISCCVKDLSEFEKDLLCNEEMIQINQDSLSDYPVPVDETEGKTVSIYKRTLENGDLAIAIFNASDEETTETIALEGRSKVRNLWAKEDLQIAAGADSFTYTVEPHCALVFRIC